MTFVVADKALLQEIVDRLTTLSVEGDEDLLARALYLLNTRDVTSTLDVVDGKRSFLVREGTSRVVDPAATTHQCSHCGNPMTLALYDVIDGYVVPKTKPASDDVLAEHAVDCGWRRSGGIGSRMRCRFCHEETEQPHVCAELLGETLNQHSKSVIDAIEAAEARIVSDTSGLRGQFAATSDAVTTLVQLIAQTLRKAVEKPVGRSAKKPGKAKPAGKRR